MRRILTILAFLLLLPMMALAGDFAELVNQLPKGSYGARAKVIAKIANSGDPRAATILQALLKGRLHQRKADKRVVIIRKQGSGKIAIDPLTGKALGPVAPRSTKKVKVNNRLRSILRVSIGALSLRSPDKATRLAAARSIFKKGDPSRIKALDAALAAETDAEVATALRQARAAAILNDAHAARKDRLAAVSVLRNKGDAAARTVLQQHADDPDIGAEVRKALDAVKASERAWQLAQNVWYGLSLGSVLMLAAIGLAITFGVMGVINMAHGELVMLGAYTTFVVQEMIRTTAPWLFDWSLFIALPLAFLVSGGVGIAIERGIVRHLYGRPLETLLATWGVSLILQQAVRTLFGPNNREVGNPSWMSGAMQLGQMTITWNRVWILLFALLVFAGLLILLRRSMLGLQMRAVTQNRAMAAEMGINTGMVDAFTFGLGAGIAGLAGVALSQIDNVSPNLGQNYIVDSFMVVVFGGAGNLWGALAGAFTLGVANKFLEPFTGAVLGKILVLVFIILFIQKRPRGLFALRGRAVEA